ncbi:MAG: hypothetical protein WCI89_02815 [bacterium]
MSLRPIIAILASFAFVFIVVPVFVSAEYTTQYYSGQGTLLVYVQVPSANLTTRILRLPGDFTAVVSGGSASPASFQGSINGVTVSVLGSYSVTALPVPGYNPIYSSGCSGNFSSGDHGLCIITEYQNSNDYNGVVTPYPYPYVGQTPLTCAPVYQTITLGQPVTFAVGGGSGIYNWSTPNRTYLGTRASLTTTLQSSGVQTVTVSSDTQTAICTVNVVGTNGPVSYTTPSYVPPTTSSAVASAYPVPTTAVTSTYVPKLPNTGFEPLSVMLERDGGAPLAFALVLLAAAGIFFAPYARKIIISSTR